MADAPLIKPIAQTNKGCRVPGCTRPYCAKGYCRLHWERQHRTGTTDDPAPRYGEEVSTWKGDDATYKSIHLRMSKNPRPPSCERCGSTSGRFEWALRPETPSTKLMYSPEGWPYTSDPADYANLCKKCHNQIDLGADACHRGHLLSGENLYIQPSNGKRFCRACQTERSRQRGLRRRVARSTHPEHGERG